MTTAVVASAVPLRVTPGPVRVGALDSFIGYDRPRRSDLPAHIQGLGRAVNPFRMTRSYPTSIKNAGEA